MKKTSREATHSIPNPIHCLVLSATEHWFSALWAGSVLVIVWCTQKNFRVKVYFTTCFQIGRLNAVGLFLLSTRTNRWKPVRTFTYWSTLMSFCLEFINVPYYLHLCNFQSKVLACFLFGLCVIHVPFGSPSQLNTSRRIVQVEKLLTIYFMFLDPEILFGTE
jgi:hypothetical protein